MSTLDPKGPGSRVWHEANRAAQLRAVGKHNAFFAAQNRMIRELKALGADIQEISDWKSDVRACSEEIRIGMRDFL